MKVHLTPEQQKRADELAKMTPTEWDAICKKCGICCLAKVELRMSDSPDVDTNFVKTVYLNRCCEKFDSKTCRCSVYQTRLNRNNCNKVNMDIVLDGKMVPASCGYVEYIFGPAPFPAQVDFNTVTPITDAEEENLSYDQIVKHAITNSVLWNERHR